ncbi:MAG: SMC-Scp complex subunit ScpB [Puniceicoccaceae bacterium]
MLVVLLVTVDLHQTLLALLFSTSEPLDLKQIQGVFEKMANRAETDASLEEKEAGEREGEPMERGPGGAGIPGSVTVAQLREALADLSEALRVRNEVYRIQDGPEGYRLVLAPQYADWVRCLRGEPRQLRLTPAMLETLSMVAYRQPVTRAEMERVRGVSVDSALGRLQELELVASVGRAELPGRPVQFGTTTKFLEVCGLRSLDELPASDVVSRAQLDEWLGRSEAPEQQQLTDTDLGLPAVTG